MDPLAEIWVMRHGQTDWSRDLRHTGRTDVDLTPKGEIEAASLAGLLGEVSPGWVFVSPMTRARRTAELAGLVPYKVDEDLREWDYGDFEGLTTVEISRQFPGWSIWDGPWPGGETADDVAARADRFIAMVRSGCAGSVAVVGHGHFGRVLAARWVGAMPNVGRWLEFDTAAWSKLGWDRGVPTLTHWNVPVGQADPQL